MDYIKVITLLCILLMLSSCSSIPRPDLGSKKVAGDTYIAKETTVLGKRLGRIVWQKKPTKSDRVSKKLSAPAEFVLWITVPGALLAGAAMIFLTGNPVIMKRLGILAGIMTVASVGAGAWLLLSAWPLAIAALAIPVIVLVYLKTKGKALNFSSVASSSQAASQ